ncbi:MAG: hypothetical protein KJN63_10565, partial [Acidimicrobiia bacterium]|nr:hypothetical protein [Acidimicrobiia bacterium]
MAFDMVGSSSSNLISYTNPSTDAFGSPADGFQKYQRGVSPSIPFAVLDDSLTFAPDTLGIIGTGNTDEFFGATDTENGDNSGPVTATWVFDINGASDLGLSIDMGAMGDFESSDAFTWTYSIDGGPIATAFQNFVDEDDSFTYTLEDGDSFTLSDPMLVDGTILSNELQTFATALTGTGNELTLTLTLETNGGTEAIAFQDIVVVSDLVVDQPLTTTCPSGLTVIENEGGSVAISAIDPDDTAAWTTLLVDPLPLPGSITLDELTVPGFGLAAEAEINVSATVPTGDYTVIATAENLNGDSEECPLSISVVPISAIHEIQGSGPTVAIAGQVAVRAIVTSLFEDTDAVEGFFLQEEDLDADTGAGSELTSEGIFVFCSDCPTTPLVGDLVTVIGTASDFNGMSEIAAFGADAVRIDSSDNSLPAPTAVVLPATLGGTNEELTFEAVEGMIVEFTDKLVVSEYFQLGRFGQVVLTVDDRPFQFTHLYEPDDIGYTAFLDGLAASQIILDDNNNDGNDAIFGPEFNEPYPYTTGFSTANYFRGGDSITGLTGVMHWSWAGFGSSDAWRIRPVDGENYEFTPENERTATPADVGGRLTVAAFNVLNYFNTIDLTSSGSSGPCGPDADQDCRGADSDAERIRQLDKIAAALSVIDADVAGLIELENDGDDQSIDDIVGALNAIAGAGTYD